MVAGAEADRPGSRTRAAARGRPRASPRPRPRGPSSRTGCRAAPAVNSCVSSAVLPLRRRADHGGARGVDHALDLRRAGTPPSRASCRARSRRTGARRPAGRTDVTPAQWNTRSTPAQRPPHRRAGRARRSFTRLQVEVLDRRVGRAALDRRAPPRRRARPSSRATCEPMKPVAPVTRTSWPSRPEVSHAIRSRLRARHEPSRGRDRQHLVPPARSSIERERHHRRARSTSSSAATAPCRRRRSPTTTAFFEELRGAETLPDHLAAVGG